MAIDHCQPLFLFSLENTFEPAGSGIRIYALKKCGPDSVFKMSKAGIEAVNKARNTGDKSRYWMELKGKHLMRWWTRDAFAVCGSFSCQCHCDPERKMGERDVEIPSFLERNRRKWSQKEGRWVMLFPQQMGEVSTFCSGFTWQTKNWVQSFSLLKTLSPEYWFKFLCLNSQSWHVTHTGCKIHETGIWTVGPEERHLVCCFETPQQLKRCLWVGGKKLKGLN